VLLLAYCKGSVTNENSNTYFFRVFTVPKQPNFCDCGVYVCQYALSMFNLRFFSFTYEHAYMSTPPSPVIKKSVPFAFDHDTIVQMRSTRKKKRLLTLSKVYHRLELLTDPSNKTTLTEAGTVSNDNALQYHLSQESDQQGLSQESTQQEEASPHLKHFVSVKSAKEAVLEAIIWWYLLYHLYLPMP
jgi:hypothetical protein